MTDSAPKWKNFTTDAFGNLTSVLEPDPLNQRHPDHHLRLRHRESPHHGDHAACHRHPNPHLQLFNFFNFTTGTTVGTLLLSATNPENGTVTYTYNTDKTLAGKTDALNQQFSYTYDSYKRVTQINLGQTVIRQFYYDANPLDSTGTFSQYGLGRLTAVQNAPTANADTFIEMYSYTQPGGITAKRLRMNRTVQSHPFTIDLDATYSYDNEGRMTSVTYPQSFYSDGSLQPQPSPVTTYTYGFDTMGRPISMTGPGVDGWGNPATVNIVNGVQYGPASEMLQMSYFGSTETRQYNTRLQMTHLTVPGQLNISYNFATQNNGQISSQTDNLSGEQITYQYDALKRLYSASASAWSQSFTYDGFGNLTDKVGTGGAPTNDSPVNAATNQLTGYSYDASGNLISTGFGWDAENRMSYATRGGTQYAYDSMSKRVWTGNYTCPGGFCGPGYGWQFQSETVFFYGIDGTRLAAYTPQVKYSSGIPQSIYYLLGEERVYFGSKYIGNANTSLMSGGTSIGQDRLGSAGKYFPYGEERNNPQLPNDTVKFATYTRDSATGLDYADQRYYDGGRGRFTNPDAYQASGGPPDPSSWNRYVYTRGDPVNRYDPLGMDDDETGKPPPTYCDLHPGVPICTPFPIVPPGVGGGVVPSPISKAYAAAGVIQNKKNWSDKCKQTLSDAGIAPVDLDNGLTVDAVSQVQTAAQHASFLYPDDTLMTEVYAHNPFLLSQADPTQTVRQVFAASGGTHALAEPNGNRIWISPMYFDFIGSYFAVGTIMHELIHNITGLTDPDIQRNLGLGEAGGSINITMRLLADCFPGGF